MGLLDALFNGGGLLGGQSQNGQLMPAQNSLGLMTLPPAQYAQARQGQNALNSSYQAMQQAGVPEPMARAAALNPEIMKTIAPEYFGGYKLVQTGESPVGKTFMMQGPGGKLFALGGAQGPGSVANGDASGMAGGTPGVGNSGMLAKGVKGYDPSLSGDAYLNQFSPDVVSAVKAYMNGDVMPSGNPRQQGIATLAKTIAQKYGQDMGIPVSDALYNSKRKMQSDLGSSSPNSIGGILANGKSAFDHLAELSDKAIGLGNYSLSGVPFGGYIANAINAVGNMAGDSNTRGAIKGFNDNALKYGQEATKFYAGTGGGEAERMNTLKTLNPETASGPELAAYLETEKSLMSDRLRQKEAQVRDVMGDQYLQQHPVITPDLQQTLQKIDANIAKLRSGSVPQGSAMPQGAALPQGWNFVGSR